MLISVAAFGFCARSALAHVTINYPLGQWDFTEEQQENGSFCGGGVSGSASPWLAAQLPFISLSGDAGETVTVRFAYSNGNLNGADEFENSIDGPSNFNTTLVVNASIPESGNLCIDTTLPPLEIGAIGIIYVAAVNAETGANVSSCATIEYIPESVEGQIVPETNITYRDFYCSNSTDLLVAETSCDCHCHDTDEHCSGQCSEEQIDAARDLCTAEYESDNPNAECDCHCHDEEEHCSGTCTDQQTTDARNECATSAGDSGANATSTSIESSAISTSTATGTGAAASATGGSNGSPSLKATAVGQILGFAVLLGTCLLS